MGRQVLLVEDEPNIRDTLRFNLTREGYGVKEAKTADEALRAFRGSKPDIILLDVMLPGMSGFEVCRIIRQESPVPIIMLTAKDQELDKVLGLGVGADDYITKPFGLQELFARMTAVLRRSDARQPTEVQLPEVEQLGPMVLDRAARRVMLSGDEIKLTAREFDLLSFFLAHPVAASIRGATCWSRSGATTTSATPRPWTCMSGGCARSSPDGCLSRSSRFAVSAIEPTAMTESRPPPDPAPAPNARPQRSHRHHRIRTLDGGPDPPRSRRPRLQARADGQGPGVLLPRATFYRWAQVWPDVCADLATAPAVQAVGDLHIENFGTWRDAEGRLVCGVNDFDEAHTLPYTIDLSRLATSAIVAVQGDHLDLTPRLACEAIEQGYLESLQQHGHALVLAEDDRWLRKLATGALRDPVIFWKQMDDLPPVRHGIEESARAVLERSLVELIPYRVARRRAGMGSLGRRRYVALGMWRGARVAREVKAFLPSAWRWAHPTRGSGHDDYMRTVGAAIRCPDPFLQVTPEWVGRRLGPDCRRIELAMLPTKRDDYRLLHAMGWRRRTSISAR